MSVMHRTVFLGRFASRMIIVMVLLWSGAARAGSDVESFMRAYLGDFDNGHARDIAAHYNTPLYMLAPNGDLRVYETPKDIRLTVKKWKRYMIKGGFDHSEWVKLNVKAVTEGTALASTAFNRVDSRGQVFQRGGATYTLRKQDGEWKIFLIHIHGPDDVLSLD